MAGSPKRRAKLAKAAVREGTASDNESNNVRAPALSTELETATRLYPTDAAVRHAAECARDKALAWVADLVDARDSKGIGAALTAFDRLQERIEKMVALTAGTPTAAENAYTIEWVMPTDEQIQRMAEAKAKAEELCKRSG